MCDGVLLGLASLEHLVVVAETASADLHFLGFAINVNRRVLHVRRPPGSGAPRAVTNVVARHSNLGAHFALGHYLPLTAIRRLGRIDAV